MSVIKLTEGLLEKIRFSSLRDRTMKYTSLMVHFNVENLKVCFHELDRNKAVGIDGQTKEDYEKQLDQNLENLVMRIKTMNYWPKPVREVMIPKANGKKRPLGISVIEDKIVQSMTAKLLDAIYEPWFKDCSYGFRPKRGCHMAIKECMERVQQLSSQVILDIDLENYFGSINHDKLIMLLEKRIKDLRFLKYIKRALEAGILSKEGFRMSTEGTPQGSIMSPILANIFAHYAIDVWYEEINATGVGIKLFRYADDVVISCANERNVLAIKESFKARMERFSLKINQDKSKEVKFSKKIRPGHTLGRFDFLGFTIFERPGIGRYGKFNKTFIQTNKERFADKLKKLKEWCKGNRSKGTKEMFEGFARRMRGHINYYGVTGNRLLNRFYFQGCKVLFRWINRRGQKRSLNWEQFNHLREIFIPKVRYSVRLYA